METVRIPEHLVTPTEPFRSSFDDQVVLGAVELAESRIAIVGLARNCAPQLAANLELAARLGDACGEWQLHVETNDNEDATDQVLADFCRRHSQATFTSQQLGRVQFSTEFAGQRTVALAEYRAACQRWVRDCAADTDYVVVIDLDAWGGWLPEGVLNGFGWLREMPDAYGMASVSLLEHPVSVNDGKGSRMSSAFLTYDAWAMRGVGQPTNYWDDYTAGFGGWKHHWIPPVGSPPVVVASAFGGMAIYETQAYLQGVYDGSDCEHVGFHQTIAQRTGKNLYLDPSMRMLMSWLKRAED
jgi:hypothetical protein